ncbi:MAG: 2-succinyl-5-enolpyruvyl-6-hydroxy-3-cyclohexene-carboxylic-acidynthase [Bacteroidota bacterium]
MAFPNGLIELAEGLFQLGVKDIILCPGSRNAPLILSFNRNGNFRTYSIVDERSAAYFGLGLARKSNNPVAICCTSGTAALNFAPAIAEAYHSKVPLIVLTADRPKEWLGQWDNQMINQTNLYQNYIHYFVEYPTHEIKSKSEDLNWYRNRIINEAYAHSMIYQKGPVHLNIPISEPFYPETNELLTASFAFKKLNFSLNSNLLTNSNKNRLEEIIFSNNKILISLGQSPKKPDLDAIIAEYDALGIPILSEPISNIAFGISPDLILGKNVKKLPTKPNLVIHIGGSVISKNHKKYLRDSAIKEIWLVNNEHNQQIPDTYQGITEIIDLEPETFLSDFLDSVKKLNLETSYYKEWKELANNSLKELTERLSNNPLEFSELNIWYHIFEAAKNQELDLHLGASMSARYPNLVGWQSKFHHCFANRGTSGIDGVLSSAIGSSQVNLEKINLCILGDLSFQYDKNGIWNKYVHPNNRIIIINNSGGGIFRLLEGSSRQPELEEFIETKQETSAKLIAESYAINYRAIQNIPSLRAELPRFLDLKIPGPRILEIEI